jgi:hypothetical protein
MPPKLSTLAPKLKGAAAAVGNGGRPSTTHSATTGGGKEGKTVKAYNATGPDSPCSFLFLPPF